MDNASSSTKTVISSRYSFFQTHWKLTDMHFSGFIASSASFHKIMEHDDDVSKLRDFVGFVCQVAERHDVILKLKTEISSLDNKHRDAVAQVLIPCWWNGSCYVITRLNCFSNMLSLECHDHVLFSFIVFVSLHILFSTLAVLYSCKVSMLSLLMHDFLWNYSSNIFSICIILLRSLGR